jgi:hypothetical protein
MFKPGDIVYGKFFTKGTLLRVTSITPSELKGDILAHNMEGHSVNSATVLDYVRKEFKKVSSNDLPLYFDMKVFNPEFTRMIKERQPT